jgi:hypothetical protein
MIHLTRIVPYKKSVRLAKFALTLALLYHRLQAENYLRQNIVSVEVASYITQENIAPASRAFAEYFDPTGPIQPLLGIPVNRSFATRTDQCHFQTSNSPYSINNLFCYFVRASCSSSFGQPQLLPSLRNELNEVKMI